MAKDVVKKYFACKCGNMQFRKEYIFSMQSQTVAVEEIYVCNSCGDEMSYKQIKQGLRDIKEKHKYIDGGNGDV